MDNFQEPDEATVKFHPEERQVSDLDCLMGQLHGRRTTPRGFVRRGLIVAYRSLVNSDRQQVEDETPAHIADVQTMTEAFSWKLLVVTTTAVVMCQRWVLAQPTEPESSFIWKESDPQQTWVQGCAGATGADICVFSGRVSPGRYECRPSLLDTTDWHSYRIALTIGNKKRTRSRCCVLTHRSGGVCVSENVVHRSSAK